MALRSVKIDLKYIEPNTVNFFYPTQHNTNNRFAILSTTNDEDDDDKTTIINNQAHKNTETAYSTLIMKITNRETIADAGATGHFVLPGTPVNNFQPAS